MSIYIISLLCCGMTIATLCDLRTGKIPNLLTFPLMLIGLVYHTASTGFHGLGFSAGGLFLGIGMLLVLYLMGGMGAGDAKLLGAVGSLVGSTGVVVVGVLSVLLGLIYSLVLLLVHLDYASSFLRRIGLSFKTLFLTGRLIPITLGVDKNQPVLRYALPIAVGTMGYVLLKITESNIIQDLLGLQFSI